MDYNEKSRIKTILYFTADIDASHESVISCNEPSRLNKFMMAKRNSRQLSSELNVVLQDRSRRSSSSLLSALRECILKRWCLVPKWYVPVATICLQSLLQWKIFLDDDLPNEMLSLEDRISSYLTLIYLDAPHCKLLMLVNGNENRKPNVT